MSPLRNDEVNMKHFRFILAGIFIVALCLASNPAWSATVLGDIENAVMCKCDDKCGKVLINCNCDTSEKTRTEILKQLESGLTKEQIIQTFVDKYGETVLSAPTKEGFNLMAWVTPFAMILGGGLGIRKLLQVWIKPKGEATAEKPASESSEISKEDSLGGYSNRLKNELDRLES